MNLDDLKYTTVLKALNQPKYTFSVQKMYSMEAECYLAGYQELEPIDVIISKKYCEDIMEVINNLKKISIIPVEYNGEVYLLENCWFSEVEITESDEVSVTIYYDKFTIIS